MGPFPGMDGGGMGGGGGRQRKNADSTKFYALLEVDKNASESEIKKAYRKLVVKHHPDKGGDPEKFKEITRAYEVLSDSDKRSKYDRFGEDGLEDGGGDPGDIFDAFFGGGGRRSEKSRKRQRTKDVTQPLKVTLEQLYNGQTKKMAITRQVIDKKKGVVACSDCDGQGVRIETIRMGPMIQRMQSQCSSCGGAGKSFKTKQEREVLDVLVQKGSPDGHKVVFSEMADEHPDADAGDVIFVLKQQEHKLFKRRGADLFMERKISLVEALCGFTLELEHLDGRKLHISTSPGEIVKPMPHGFDPTVDVDSKPLVWEVLENTDCPDIETVAQGDTTDIDTLKNACDTQLKRKGIQVGAFIVDSQRAYFKAATREEILAAKKSRSGHTMYLAVNPNAHDDSRLMKAVKGEGMPTFRNPFVHGNLFLSLTIEFPTALKPEVQESLRGLLPTPFNRLTFSNDEVEVHTIEDMDPVQSYNSNKINMTSNSEAYDDDDDGERGGMSGPGGVQCKQM